VFNLPFLRRKNSGDEESNKRKSGGLRNVLEEDSRPKRERKKKEPQKPWTLRDRLVVGGVLLATFFLGAYFWYKGQGQIPTGAWLHFNFSWPSFSFEEKIILK